jgi:hypothetical protein
MAVGLFAQDYGRDRNAYGDRYRDRRGYNRGDVLDHAFSDLQWAASSSMYARHQRGHFDHAMRELGKFQDKFQRGHFDKHSVDEVIDEMSHLSRAGELNPSVRETMARDADALRVFRAGRYPGYGGGYGNGIR